MHFEHAKADIDMKLRFLGASGTVTGSRYLVQGRSSNVLVDCGLFQGVKSLRLKNWEPFSFSPNEISSVFLTHAHLDHSGYLPRLLNEGFRGRIYCTPATRDLCRIMLMDSAKIQEEEARFANRKGYSKHRPALPLYTAGDAHSVLERFSPIEFNKKFDHDGFQVEFTRSGHILGAAAIKIFQDGVSVTFSGDVGRPHDSIIKAPEPLPQTDYLVVESTYGDRRHPSIEASGEIARCVGEIAKSEGALLIPAFTVGRAQQVMYEIARLKRRSLIPDIPVFLDSPMAVNVTDLYVKYAGEHRLGREAVGLMCDNVKYVSTVEESKALMNQRGPRIIISASGMATGGRVLFHLENLASDPRNRIVFVGFQAAGTRGKSLTSGCQEIKIHGHYVPIKATVENIESLSAHGDYAEILDWLERSRIRPRKVFVCHGEPEASDAMRRRLEEKFHWSCVIPQVGDSWDLV